MLIFSKWKQNSNVTHTHVISGDVSSNSGCRSLSNRPSFIIAMTTEQNPCGKKKTQNISESMQINDYPFRTKIYCITIKFIYVRRPFQIYIFHWYIFNEIAYMNTMYWVTDFNSFTNFIMDTS